MSFKGADMLVNKIRSIFIIVVLILNLGVFGLIINFTSTSSMNIRSENNPYCWQDIEVLSEIFNGQNLNIGLSSEPKIAVENNKIYVVWEDKNNTNNAGTDWDIFYRSYDGNIWTEIQVISEPTFGSNTNIGRSENPDIVVKNGNIYVVWHDDSDLNGAGTDDDIFYRCNITGSGWEDIQVISEPVFSSNLNTGDSFGPTIAVENNLIYIAWQDSNITENSGNDWDIFFRCNLTGTSWEYVQIISEPVIKNNINIGQSLRPSIEAENNKIYIVWHDNDNTNGAGGDNDIFYRCNISGSSWGNIEVISEPLMGNNINIAGSYFADLAVENDNIYVVWEDWDNLNNAGIDADIFYRCNLSGNNWEDIQVISEPASNQDTNIGHSNNPAIQIENNNIYVVWHDVNDTAFSGSDEDIFYRSNLTGTNWEDAQIISEPIENNNANVGGSSRPDIAINSGLSFVVWEDGNDTNNAGTDNDIFFRKTIYKTLFLKYPIIDPILGNTSTFFNFTILYQQYENKPPINMYVNLNGMNYSMFESDSIDLNYVDGKAYYYNITLNINDSHFHQFWAYDGINYSHTSIFNKPDVYNTQPMIVTNNNLTAIEDTYYEVTYQYDDIDRENIAQIGTWNFTSNATWLSSNPTTAMLFGTPTNDDVGTYWVYIEINDTMDMDFTNFTLTVLNVNDNPIINTTNVEITYEDEVYEVDYNATDIDSLIENQIWSLDTNATSWLDIDTTTGIISGTPTNDDVGEYWVNVSVIDGDGGDAYITFTLIVLNVNDRPEITTADVITTNVGIFYSVDYNATDIDSPLSKLAWSLDTNATWLDLDAGTGVLSGSPANSDAGWYNVNISVDDGDDGSDWHEFILTVTSEGFENDPPDITTIDKVSITAGTSYNVIYVATDDRTPLDVLIWSYNSNASWLSFNKITRTLSGNPTLSDVGWYWVNITVGDGEGGFDSHNYTLTVWATANEPPDILTEDDINAVVDELYSVDYEAEDDHTPIDKLVWSLETNTSEWLGIDKVTGVLSGTPKLEDVGSYWVKVSVFDREDGWDFTNFTLYVTTEPLTKLPPKLTNPTMTPLTGNTNTEFTFSVDYSHPDGDLPDSIQVVIDGNANNMESTNGHYKYSTKLSEGNHTYYFTTTLGDIVVNTNEYQTGYIDKSTDVEPDDGNGDEDNTMLYAGIGIVVIIIIVILILLFIFLKKKKVKEEEEAPVVEEPPPEAPPQEQPPEPMVPQEPISVPEQPPPPEVPPEQVPAPETPPSEQPPIPETPPPEQPPTPEVTPPQVVPQVEPAPEPAPMPQVEEEPVPTPQPQVEAQEPAVEQSEEAQVQPQEQPVPKIKTPEDIN